MVNEQRSDAEHRFAHLLQPIRDLSKNWVIDIARYLDEYLDEVRHPVCLCFNIMI